MRIEESVIIHRPPEEVFAFLEVRSNDAAWMEAVVESEWLDSAAADPAAPIGVGRRGRMVMKLPGHREEFIDEVTEYEPGTRIAHRTLNGPIQLNTACICEPAGDGCRSTVLGAAERLPGGMFGRFAAPVGRQGHPARLPGRSRQAQGDPRSQRPDQRSGEVCRTALTGFGVGSGSRAPATRILVPLVLAGRISILVPEGPVPFAERPRRVSSSRHKAQGQARRIDTAVGPQQGLPRGLSGGGPGKEPAEHPLARSAGGANSPSKPRTASQPWTRVSSHPRAAAVVPARQAGVTLDVTPMAGPYRIPGRGTRGVRRWSAWHSSMATRGGGCSGS